MLDSIPQEYYELCSSLGLYPNADVRIHRLYPGNYPAYPGWHCDGEFRETYFSQPDLEKIPVSYHVIQMVSTHPEGVSNTEILNEEIDLDVGDGYDLRKESDQSTLWGKVHRHIEMGDRRYNKVQIQDGDVLQFDSRTIHRCMPAKVRGWRMFMRMSMWHKPNLGEGGKISKQEQVYSLSN